MTPAYLATMPWPYKPRTLTTSGERETTLHHYTTQLNEHSSLVAIERWSVHTLLLSLPPSLPLPLSLSLSLSPPSHSPSLPSPMLLNNSTFHVTRKTHHYTGKPTTIHTHYNGKLQRKAGKPESISTKQSPHQDANTCRGTHPNQDNQTCPPKQFCYEVIMNCLNLVQMVCTFVIKSVAMQERV